MSKIHSNRKAWNKSLGPKRKLKGLGLKCNVRLGHIVQRVTGYVTIKNAPIHYVAIQPPRYSLQERALSLSLEKKAASLGNFSLI